MLDARDPNTTVSFAFFSSFDVRSSRFSFSALNRARVFRASNRRVLLPRTCTSFLFTTFATFSSSFPSMHAEARRWGSRALWISPY